MADWSDLPFDSGDVDYIDQLDNLRDRTEAIATEVENARDGEANLLNKINAIDTVNAEVVTARDSTLYGAKSTLDERLEDSDSEISNARQGQANLVTNIQRYFLKGGETGDINCNGQKLVNGADAVANTDYTTLQQVNALIIGGGSPGDIPITSLGIGTGTASQLISINGGGTAVVGISPSSLALTGIGVGSLAVGQMVRRGSGSALEAVTGAYSVGSGIDPDTLSCGFYIGSDWTGSVWGSGTATILDNGESQIAFSETNLVYVRNYNGSSWEAWRRVKTDAYVTESSAEDGNLLVSGTTHYIDPDADTDRLLPASPIQGDIVKLVLDSTNPFTGVLFRVFGNGNSILYPNGSTDTTLVIDFDVPTLTFEYTGTYWIWR